MFDNIFRSSNIAQDDAILNPFDSVYRIHYDRLVHFGIVNVCCRKKKTFVLIFSYEIEFVPCDWACVSIRHDLLLLVF